MKTRVLQLIVLIVGAVGVLFGGMAFVRFLTHPLHPVAVTWTTEIGIVLLAIGYVVAACQGWRLLNFARQQQPFTVAAMIAIRRFRNASALMTVGVALWLPLVYVVIQHTDAPGLGLIGVVAVLVPLAMTLFLSILHQLWQSAVTLQQHEELTI